MAQKLSYAKLLYEIKPSLEAISTLKYPIKTPMSFHLSIAENLEKIESQSKAFWETRNKILASLAEKDKGGEPKKFYNEETKQEEYELSDANKIIWGEKLDELKKQEVKIDLQLIDKKHFEGVDGLKPIYLKGILSIFKK